jgi:hypothetical protein
MLTKLFAALFFASVAHAWAHGDHHHVAQPLITVDQMPVAYFSSLEQASDTALSVTQFFVDSQDAQAVALYDQYSLIKLGPPNETPVAEQLALQPALSVKLLEPQAGPVPQTANVFVVVYTPSRALLFRYELYAPQRGQWQFSDIEIAHTIQGMRIMLGN